MKGSASVGAVIPGVATVNDCHDWAIGAREHSLGVFWDDDHVNDSTDNSQLYEGFAVPFLKCPCPGCERARDTDQVRLIERWKEDFIAKAWPLGMPPKQYDVMEIEVDPVAGMVAVEVLRRSDIEDEKVLELVFVFFPTELHEPGQGLRT